MKRTFGLLAAGAEVWASALLKVSREEATTATMYAEMGMTYWLRRAAGV